MIWKEKQLDLVGLLNQLIAALPHELATANETTWTQAIKDGLCTLGHLAGLFVCGHGSSCDDGEWLLDHVWLDQTDWRAILAVESESKSPAEVEADFLKLLTVKAPYKLIVFRHHGAADNTLELLRHRIERYPYHLDGEEYIAIERRADAAGIYHLLITADGPLKSGNLVRTRDVSWPWQAGSN